MQAVFRHRLYWAFLCTVVLSIHLTPSARADAQYTVTNLGALPGDTESWPSAINNLGQVVGYSAVPGANYNAWLYSNGSMTSLDDPAHPGSMALALNNVGQVAGTSGGLNFGEVFVSSVGSTQYIGFVGPVPTGINDSGTVVGNYFDNTTASAFMYNNGVMQDLATLLGGGITRVGSINNAGQIVGQSGAGHAVIYNNGVMQDLGTLGGPYSWGSAINNLGDVAGSSWPSPSNSIEHAFLYTQSTGMIDIGQSLGNIETLVYGINDSDQVVGYINGNSGNRAFLYSGGVLYNLNDLIDPALQITLVRAVGINDMGQIIAQGEYAPIGLPGAERAFLLTPTPEPGTCATLLGTICGFLLLRRRSSACAAHMQP